jgi:hypothetical protein
MKTDYKAAAVSFEVPTTARMVFSAGASQTRYVLNPRLRGIDDVAGGCIVIQDVIDECGDFTAPWFLFCEQDCAFPLMYLVRARFFEQAYEDFIDACVEPLTDPDDYDEALVYRNSKGEPVNTEAVQGFEVKLVEVTL